MLTTAQPLAIQLVSRGVVDDVVVDDVGGDDEVDEVGGVLLLGLDEQLANATVVATARERIPSRRIRNPPLLNLSLMILQARNSLFKM